jgi:hypothetical protein
MNVNRRLRTEEEGPKTAVVASLHLSQSQVMAPSDAMRKEMSPLRRLVGDLEKRKQVGKQVYWWFR